MPHCANTTLNLILIFSSYFHSCLSEKWGTFVLLYFTYFVCNRQCWLNSFHPHHQLTIAFFSGLMRCYYCELLDVFLELQSLENIVQWAKNLHNSSKREGNICLKSSKKIFFSKSKEPLKMSWEGMFFPSILVCYHSWHRIILWQSEVHNAVYRLSIVE